jgi:redox-sensitive bicupin YhaK (pirin superfamily)
MLPTTEDVGIGPHPHIGLHTVTWLLEGELLHRDGLGTEQPIRPGQLNLMTAGHGIAHAEEAISTGERHQGLQLWVAQPEATRHGDPAFEHHAELPRLQVGPATVTVLVGEVDGTPSPARRDTPLVGAEVLVPDAATAEVPLDPAFEHALVVAEGAVRVGGEGGTIVTPGHLAYLGLGRDELALTADGDARLLLLGGEPFEATPLMWWNYVARTRAEVWEAHRDWEAGERFAPVDSALARIPSVTPPWDPAR